MKLFDKIFKKKKAEQPKVESKPKKKSDKELATERGEPYVAILSMDIDPENLHQGAFELDWNDKFVANLIRAGYQGKPTDTDAEIVDRWWTQICRNVALELYEQQQADPENRYRTDMRVVRTKDIGDGRSEVS